MIQTNKTLIASAVIATSILAACGGSNSKNDIASDKNITLSNNSFKQVDCKTMLPAISLAMLTDGSSCGYLTVPEKHSLYGQPASDKKIEIAVIKLASTSSNKQSDPIVYLEGGPGGSASASISQIVQQSSFLKSRDVYMVDQRGTGYSKPALVCTEFGEAGTISQVEACKVKLEKSGIDLNAYHSVHNAMDFIQLRKDLKVSQWNLYGTSYGTRLATTIMREDSEGIRSVILDGMFPIEVNGISDTPWANYESLNQIIKNCENTAGCHPNDMKATIENIIARMHNEGMIEESRKFIQALLERISQPSIINYLAGVNEDISKYAPTMEVDTEAVEQNESDLFYNAMGLSTVCADEYPFLNITSLIDDNSQDWSASTQLAVNGMFHMGFDAISCKAWNVTPANSIETQAVTSNLPVLILNGLQDTQTPAAWGELVAKNIPNAQNIVNPQGGHGQLFLGSNCFDTLAENFLAEPNKKLNISCIATTPELTYQDSEQESPASFTFKNNDTSSDIVYMNGVIGSNTLTVIQKLFANYPQVKTIIMQNVPGSMDDEINLLASAAIRNHGVTTHIPADGMVASGGTDMFLAGINRTIEAGARLGVHSWSDGSGKAALDYPREHQVHTKYLDYYKLMGIPADFYWYTLAAATAENIHWMTTEDIAKYGILTE